MSNPTTETGIVVVFLFQLVLQITQLFFSNRQSSKDLLIKDLQERITAMQVDFQARITNITLELSEERGQRRKLETAVFDLTKEKAFLDGQLQNQQKRKEDLILNKALSKH